MLGFGPLSKQPISAIDPFRLIQSISAANTTFVSTVTTASFTSTVGNTLIATAQADTVAQNGITITDNKGNTWARAISTSLAATFDEEIWYCNVVTGGSGHTVTATDNGGGVDSLLIVREYQGILTASPLDKTAGATGTVTTAMASGSTAAITYDVELVVGGGVASGNVTITPGSSYEPVERVNTVFSTLAMESKTVYGLATQSAEMTSGTAGSFVMNVATFKADTFTAAPPSTTSRLLALLGVG